MTSERRTLFGGSALVGACIALAAFAFGEGPGAQVSVANAAPLAGTAQTGTVSPSPQVTSPSIEPALMSAFMSGVCGKFTTKESCFYSSGAAYWTETHPGYCGWSSGTNKCELLPQYKCSGTQIKDAGSNTCSAAPSTAWRKLACKMDRRLRWNDATGKCEHPGAVVCASKPNTQWYGDIEGCLTKTCTVNGQSVPRRSDGWCPIPGGSTVATNKARAIELKQYFKTLLTGPGVSFVTGGNDAYNTHCRLQVQWTSMTNASHVFKAELLPRYHALKMRDWAGEDNFRYGPTWEPFPMQYKVHPSTQWVTAANHGDQLPGMSSVLLKQLSSRDSSQAGAWLVDRVPGRWAQWKQITTALPECQPQG